MTGSQRGTPVLHAFQKLAAPDARPARGYACNIVAGTLLRHLQAAWRVSERESNIFPFLFSFFFFFLLLFPSRLSISPHFRIARALAAIVHATECKVSRGEKFRRFSDEIPANSTGCFLFFFFSFRTHFSRKLKSVRFTYLNIENYENHCMKLR